MKPAKRIGKFTHNLTQVADEYLAVAKHDEKIGNQLIVHREYRHGIYFLIQAMEKYVRASIFRLVNPNTAYFRERTRTHDVDELIVFLIEIISADELIRQQIKTQLDEYVLQGVWFGKLHNDLRYPKYSEKYENYSLLQVTSNDAQIVSSRLQLLKKYLADLRHTSS